MIKNSFIRTILLIIIFALIFFNWKYYHESFSVADVKKIDSEQQIKDIKTQLNLGSDFSLIGHDGKIYNSEDYRGKFLLLYFGYTYCPDICPTELSKISKAMEELKEYGDKVEALFITIDPKRDTLEHLKEYITNFPNITALTGSEEEISKIIKDYKIYASFLDQDDKEHYLIDHSTFTYLMDPSGKITHHYTLDDDYKVIVNSIKENIQKTENKTESVKS